MVERVVNRRRLPVLAVVLVLMAATVWAVASNQPRALGSFPDQVVYVATGENFPDALGAGPAAALVKAPILLVARDHIPAETATELTRLHPFAIIIIGGTAVVSADVETQLESYATSVTRIAGANRYDTAAKLSAATFPTTLDADTLDGRDGLVYANPAWSDRKTTGPTLVSFDATNVLEVTFAPPAAGGILVSAGLSFRDTSNAELLSWIQVDNSTCAEAAANVYQVDFGYASTSGTAKWGDTALAGTLPISTGSHTVTLCTREFGDGTSTIVYGASIVVQFTGELNQLAQASVGDAPAGSAPGVEG